MLRVKVRVSLRLGKGEGEACTVQENEIRKVLSRSTLYCTQIDTQLSYNEETQQAF